MFGSWPQERSAFLLISVGVTLPLCTPFQTSVSQILNFKGFKKVVFDWMMTMLENDLKN